MKVKLKWHEDMWQTIKDMTMTTISKDTGIYPSSEWKRRLLLCEHSPIRIGRIVAKFYDIKTYVATHFVRHHIGFTPFVSTRRADRGHEGEIITRDSPVDMAFDGNFQAHINVSRKRLCIGGASVDTREAWTKYLDEVVAPIEPELRRVCVKECVYRNGFCPEFNWCGYNQTEAFEKELIDYTDILKGQINEKTSIHK